MGWIRLYAYFNQNLGDDLMVRILLQRYPQYHFYSDSWAPGPELPNFVNAETLQRRYGRLNHILNILTLNKRKDFFLNAVRARYARKCICSVYIGGSLYMQDGTPAYHLAREEGKLDHKPLFVIGANFGPYREEEFRDGFEAYFCRCGGVTFRDRKSEALFVHCGNVRYAPDVVLNLPALPGKSDGTVLISVIDLEHRPALAQWQEAYEDFLARLCSACLAQGKRPVLLSFCENEGDARAVGRILGRLRLEHRVCTGALYYRGAPEEILYAFETAERVIATRFHALILALCCEKPVFAIAYNEKITNVLEDLNFDRFCALSQLSFRNPEELLARCALPEDLPNYRKMAEGQFSQLDAFLKEGNRW